MQTIHYLWLKCPNLIPYFWPKLLKNFGDAYTYRPHIMEYPPPPLPSEMYSRHVFLYSSSEPNKIPSLKRFKYKQFSKYKITFQPQYKKGNHPYAIEWNFLLYTELWRFREFERHSYKLTSSIFPIHSERSMYSLIIRSLWIPQTFYELYVQPIRFPNHKLGYSYLLTSSIESQVSTCCNFWIN